MNEDPEKKEKQEEFIKTLPKIGSPVDITLGHFLKEYWCPNLDFLYYESIPETLEIYNTGSTVLVKGAWEEDRPCLVNGPFSDKYIFIQLHFHWGRKLTAGSEHTMDGERYCMEMHVVHFKREYLFPDVAKKKEDGLVVVAYLFKFWDNPKLALLISSLSEIKKANSSFVLMPEPLSELCPAFNSNFFLYKGTIDILGTNYTALWVLPRYPIGISEKQLKEFQPLLNPVNKPITDNTRDVKSSSKDDIFFVNPSPAQFGTMMRFPF